MSVLTDEELAYFSNALSFNGNYGQDEPDEALQHSLSVETEVPNVLANILGKSKLTLLAEISYYRLFFPLKLRKDEFGGLSPTLGTPEVLDIRGVERSWRLDEAKDIRVIDSRTKKNAQVLSLSSSGMTLKVPDEFSAKRLSNSSQLILPNGVELDMAYDVVRKDNDVMAVKINTQGGSREALREFLFNQHKSKYKHLYDGLNN